MATRLRIALTIDGLTLAGRDATRLLKAYQRDFGPERVAAKLPQEKVFELIFERIPDRKKKLFVSREPKGLSPEKSPYVQYLRAAGVQETRNARVARERQQQQLRWVFATNAVLPNANDLNDLTGYTWITDPVI